MKKVNFKSTLLIAIATASFYTASCSKKSNNEDTGDGTIATVEFNVGQSEFEGLENINSRSATPSNNQESANQTLTNTIDLNNGLLLVAEIAPESNTKTNGDVENLTHVDQRKGAIVRDVLPDGIRYRVLVFNSDGTYNMQQEYTRGSESSAPPMLLDGGRTYTFLVYSFNTIAAIPAYNFTGPQTLVNANLTVNGNQDFMLFRRDIQLVGGPSPNRLDVVLKHRFSQVTTIIDASLSGYNPQSITASFGPHSATAEINLANGTILRSASTERSNITSSLNNGTTTSSYSTIVNAAANIITDYRIASLRIGELTLTNLIPFEALPIAPGVKYNLTLRVTPTDRYLTHLGESAVLINGQIWRRHNLGANTGINADVLPQVQDLHGHYYQWGRSAVVASQSTPATVISGYDRSTTQAANSWNSTPNGTPTKTGSDPCPNGYRVPTEEEFRFLFANTIESDYGVFVEENRYSNAKIFTSKRDANVKTTFQIAGGRHPDGGYLSRRGLFGFYSTSRKSTVNSARRLGLREGISGVNFDDSSVAWGSSIRCIAQ